MLQYNLLNNHAGIMLMGDYHSLKVLYNVIHDVNQRSPLIKNKEGWLLNLAFDTRKAFEQQREIFPPPENFEEVGTLYGVQMLWPVILVQHRMIRASLAYIDTGKQHQAIAYTLEWVLESALQDDFGNIAPTIKEKWLKIDPTHSYPEEKLNSRAAIFCAWHKKERKNYLANLLESLDPMYPMTYKLSEYGKAEMLSPEKLDTWEDVEWPDPKW